MTSLMSTSAFYVHSLASNHPYAKARHFLWVQNKTFIISGIIAAACTAPYLKSTKRAQTTQQLILTWCQMPDHQSVIIKMDVIIHGICPACSLRLILLLQGTLGCIRTLPRHRLNFLQRMATWCGYRVLQLGRRRELWLGNWRPGIMLLLLEELKNADPEELGVWQQTYGNGSNEGCWWLTTAWYLPSNVDMNSWYLLSWLWKVTMNLLFNSICSLIILLFNSILRMLFPLSCLYWAALGWHSNRHWCTKHNSTHASHWKTAQVLTSTILYAVHAHNIYENSVQWL